MTNWLIAKFIKDPDNIHDPKVRLAYGRLSSITGMICNILLFAVKFLIGTFTGAISITADAFNNLSDALSCIATMAGYRMASKPADKDHPFGHGRMEYLFSQVIVVMIFLVAWDLLKDSIMRIREPSEIIFSIPVFIVLIITILVKVWMGNFNTALGKKTNSVAMLATAQDSRNDVLVTSIAVLAMVLSSLTKSNFPFDGVAGVLVAIFIMKSGYDILKDVLSLLLGVPASHELVSQIEKLIVSHKEIIGVHDVIIHDYGSTLLIGSADVEMDQDMRFVDAHDVADTIEKEILQETGVQMTLHMDPVDTHDPLREKLNAETLSFFTKEAPEVSIHDVRLSNEDGRKVLSFDALLPFAYKGDTEALNRKFTDTLKEKGYDVTAAITFEHGYTEEGADEEE